MRNPFRTPRPVVTRPAHQLPTGVVFTVSGVTEHVFVGGSTRTYRAMIYEYTGWRLYTSPGGTGLEAVVEAPEALPLTPGKRYRLVLEELDG